jgi:hypothetical protein
LTEPTSLLLDDFLDPNQPPPMPEVRDDMPQPPVTPSTTVTAASRVSEADALHTNCVTKPLSEHLPGLVRTGIP